MVDMPKTKPNNNQVLNSVFFLLLNRDHPTIFSGGFYVM